MLRICLDARLISGISGGVESVAIGLASSLSNLSDGEEEYSFLTYADSEEWLRPYIHGPCRILRGPTLPRTPLNNPAKNFLTEQFPFLMDCCHKVWNGTPLAHWRPYTPPRSDGTIEAAGIEIMHFINQEGFLTKVPSIYHPHDLQHLHLPQFFSLRVILIREVLYRALCNQARLVPVASSWTKRDVKQRYGLTDEKVQVVPMAPVLTAYAHPTEYDLAVTQRKYSLPESFIFYPAQTWTHKNHLGLLEALAILRDQHHQQINLVCSGMINDFFSQIEKRIRALALSKQVQFLGFVSPLEIQCLYKLARGVVVPSKFEAASGPVWEAFLAGTPVACSNVTSLPEQAGDAALVFDPYRPAEMAGAILRLWTDETLRRHLLERGQKRVAQFSWDRTARLFRAHYRRLAQRPLNKEDRELLAAPPLI
jgi:glycosyltransferase involved in cell wall biosynthesis